METAIASGCFITRGRVSAVRSRHGSSVPLAAYKKLATKAAKVWKKYGALEYRECVSDDVPEGKVTSFPRSVKAKKEEVVVFAWIVYKSRAHRDQVNKKVMADPSMKYDPAKLPFDGARMFWGGFKAIVQA